MTNIEDYIKSGAVEAYVLGIADTDEQAETEKLAKTHPEVRAAIDEFSVELEAFVNSNSVTVNPLVRPMAIATFDYLKRIEDGEEFAILPELTGQSKVADYNKFLTRADMMMPNDFDNLFVKLIRSNSVITTAIIWMKDFSFVEIHHDKFESILVIEGACTITFNGNRYDLTKGSFLSIPLHVKHTITVSHQVCKVILERVAA